MDDQSKVDVFFFFLKGSQMPSALAASPQTWTHKSTMWRFGVETISAGANVQSNLKFCQIKGGGPPPARAQVRRAAWRARGLSAAFGRPPASPARTCNASGLVHGAEIVPSLSTDPEGLGQQSDFSFVSLRPKEEFFFQHFPRPTDWKISVGRFNGNLILSNVSARQRFLVTLHQVATPKRLASQVQLCLEVGVLFVPSPCL